jgi:flavin-dependent dehydrogenase
MDSVKNIDLIIVGAGPAGLSTAMHLIKSDPSWGKRMIVLEKAIHPRPKLCGGGLTRFGMRILQDLGFELPVPIPNARVNNIFITYRNRKIHLRGKPQFVVFNRPEFDHHLVNQTRKRRITILEDEAVKSLEVYPDGVRVDTNKGIYLAQSVVGADGSLGIVRTSLRGQKDPKRIARTLEVLTPAALTSPRFTQNSAIFDFTHINADFQGYFWDFPAMVGGDPTHNRGVYDSRFNSSRSRVNISGLLKKGLQAVGGDPSSGPIKGHPIHWFSPTNQISGHRVLLVGDAAGADVLLGEGIGPALGYGKVAAREINKAFQKNDFRFPHYRTNVLLSSLGRLFLLRWILANYVYRLSKRPVFMHILWTAGQILATIWPAEPVDSKHEYPNE